MRVSIIIPFHNEEETLPIVYEKLGKVKVPGVIFEMIFSNDGSYDGSDRILSALIKGNRNVKYTQSSKNHGKGSAIRKALKIASGEYVLIQDADAEYDPKYIPRLLQPIISEEADVVFGTRLKRLPHFSKEERSFRFALHYFGNRMLSLLTSILYGAWITDMETGYKVFPRKAFRIDTLISEKFDIEPEITAKLLKSKCKIVEVPITTIPRGYSEGKKLNTIQDGFAALRALVRFRFT